MKQRMAAGKFVGVVGYGHWGKNVARNLYRLKALHTICDADPGKLKGLKNKFRGIRVTANFGELLKSPGIRAIAIVTPAATHYRLAREALLADKDLFVEKPLALTANEAKKLVQLAQARNRILMVGHIYRYHPAFIKLKDLSSKGTLGNIQYIYSNRLNIGKFRTEENILWSFAPHDVSFIIMLLGQDPRKIKAFAGAYLNKGIYDTTVTTLEFKGGIKAHIFVSWLHPYKEQKLVVIGSKAMAVFDDLSKEKLFIYPHKIEIKNNNIPILQKAKYYNPKIDKKEPLYEELKHFIYCVLTRKKPETDGYEGLRVVKLLEIADRSLKKGQMRKSV